jgi:hypothetical protein
MLTIDFSARSPEKRRASAVTEFSTRSPSAGRSTRHSALRNMTADNVETSDTDSSECYSDEDSQSDKHKVSDNPLSVGETNTSVPKPITPAYAVHQTHYFERKDQDRKHHLGAHPLKWERKSERKSEFFSDRVNRDSPSDEVGNNAQPLQAPASPREAERRQMTMAHYMSHQLAHSDDNSRTRSAAPQNGLTLRDAALAALPVRAEPSSPPTYVRYLHIL